MTGCGFAQYLASKASRLPIALHVEGEPPRAEWLNYAFDASADADQGVVALFPCIFGEDALVEFLNALSRERWRVRRLSKLSPGGGVRLGLEWKTKRGDISEPMGLAPFHWMPVTRRSPYVAIATWPGGRSNPFRGHASTPPGRPGVVSLLDVSHGLDLENYERRWAKTTDQVANLMSVPPDNAALYRSTGFVISPAAAEHLVFDPSVSNQQS
jgi:hypothetical protein